jgi:hypothetical protein
MNTTNEHRDLIVELDARHDELMLKLDELDRRVEQTLIQCQGYRRAEGGSPHERSAKKGLPPFDAHTAPGPLNPLSI